VELETVRETVATTPFEIGVALRPYKTHVAVPGVVVHETFLFAAAAAGPAKTVTEENSVVE
jgi:hypothetical protein